jgi:hypothetical protein
MNTVVSQVQTGGAPVGAPERSRVRSDLDDCVERMLGTLRAAPDGALPIRGMYWRVGEVGAHLVQTIRVLTDAVNGRPTPYGDRGEFNAATDQRLVDELPERVPARLADLVQEGYTAFTAAIGDRGDQEIVERFQGYSVAGTCAVWVLDLNIHGHQIATASSGQWLVKNDQLRTGFELVLPQVYDRDAARNFRGVYAMHLKGTAPLVYGFHDGELQVGDAAGRVDCHLGVDPVAFLLTTIGALPQWRAVLTGKMLAWGRRPWLAARLNSLLPRVPHGGVGARRL